MVSSARAMDTTECSTSFAEWRALVSEARPMIVFHLRFCYVCIYVCPQRKRRRQKTGKLHKGWLQLRKLAAQNLPCTCAYPRGLPVGSYFVLYQRSIKPIQRWRSVNVHLQTIRMLNSMSLHIVARNSSWGRDACPDGLSTDCLQKNSHNVEDAIPERVTRLQSLHTCLSFAY